MPNGCQFLVTFPFVLQELLHGPGTTETILRDMQLHDSGTLEITDLRREQDVLDLLSFELCLSKIFGYQMMIFNKAQSRK